MLWHIILTSIMSLIVFSSCESAKFTGGSKSNFLTGKGDQVQSYRNGGNANEANAEGANDAGTINSLGSVESNSDNQDNNKKTSTSGTHANSTPSPASEKSAQGTGDDDDDNKGEGGDDDDSKGGKTDDDDDTVTPVDEQVCNACYGNLCNYEKLKGKCHKYYNTKFSGPDDNGMCVFDSYFQKVLINGTVIKTEKKNSITCDCRCGVIIEKSCQN